MSSQSIEEQHKFTQKFCRLCLSEEMLEDVFKFKQDDTIRQISDLLSIEVSEDDQISRSICAICRARLHEFHDYKLSCLEVQDVLRGQICPAVEEDLSAQVFEQIKSDLQDDLNTEEDLLEEMQISPENTELDAEAAETVQIEKHVRNCISIYNCEHGCVGMKFDGRQTQLQHYVNVHDDRLVQCKICHKLFRHKSSLRYHTLSVHQLKRYHCVICKSSYPIKYRLDNHIKVAHSANMDYYCSKCKYSTNLKHNLNRHMLMHARKEKEKKQIRSRTIHPK